MRHVRDMAAFASLKNAPAIGSAKVSWTEEESVLASASILPMEVCLTFLSAVIYLYYQMRRRKIRPVAPPPGSAVIESRREGYAIIPISFLIFSQL
jgi:hypothetical protein